MALGVFVCLATLFLADVLFLDRSLGAFDIILKQPGWRSEFLVDGVHRPELLDSPTAHYPQRQFDWDTLKHGHNPSYSPYIFGGIPWATQGIGAFVTSLPQLITNVADAIDWSTWLRLILAGFFMYLLLLELGLPATCAIFGGVLWTYNLHQIAWLEFPQHLATQLWMPLLFLSNVLTLRSGFRREHVIALMVLNVLFFTSGYTQIVLYSFVFAGLFNSLFIFFVEPIPGVWGNLKRWVGIHVIYLGAFIFYGLHVLIEADMIAHGLRGEQEFRDPVGQLELSINTVLEFLKSLVPSVEDVKRFYTPDYYGGIWTGQYTSPYGNIVEDSGYVGVLAVFLFLIGAITTPGAKDQKLRFALLVLLAIGFSLMYRNPISVTLLGVIPLAEKGNFSRFITIIIFFGIILSTMGLRSLIDRSGKWGDRSIWIAMGLFMLFPLMGEVYVDDFRLRPFLYPLLALILIVLPAFWLCRFGLFKKYLGEMLIVLTVVDLFSATYAFNTRLDNENQFPANNAIRFLLNDSDIFRVAVISDVPMYTPNVLSYFQIPTVEGYSTVMPTEYLKFVRSVFRGYHVTLNGMLLLTEPNVEALRLLNVKYLITRKPHEDDRLEKVLEGREQYIYKIKNWLSRVYCASNVMQETAESGADLYKIITTYDRPALVGGDLSITESECEISQLRAYTNNVRFDVRSDGRALVVLPYGFLKNWRAEIDQQPARIVTVNRAFMGLIVPPGQSSVRVYYRDDRDTLGALVMSLGAVLMLVLLIGRMRSVTGYALAAIAVLTIAKSALSVPLVRNDNVPERLAVSNPLPVEQLGKFCVEKATPSPRINRTHPFQTTLDIPAAGLVRLQLLAATYLQPSLPYTVRVVLRDSRGRELILRDIPGRRIRDNRWFQLSFPPLTAEGPVDLTVGSSNDAERNPFSVWLDRKGHACMVAWYARESSARAAAE